MTILKPWKSIFPFVKRNWLNTKADKNNEEDQLKIVDLATNDKSKNVRIAAINLLSDQNKLKEIVQSDKIPKVRRSAVKRIVEQEILIDLALSSKDTFVRFDAIKKIKDKEIIKNISQNDSKYSIRKYCYDILGLSDTEEALVDKRKNEPKKLSRIKFWLCSNCNSVYKKDSLEQKIIFYEGSTNIHISGTIECGQCHKIYKVEDIYFGKHDIPKANWNEIKNATGERIEL